MIDMGKLKQIFCRHRYADRNKKIVLVDPGRDIVQVRNYCVKCGKSYDVKVSLSCMVSDTLKDLSKRSEE